MLLQGGNEADIRYYPTVTGTLKGYDALMNLVLDDVEESLQGKPTSLLLDAFPPPFFSIYLDMSIRCVPASIHVRRD